MGGEGSGHGIKRPDHSVNSGNRYPKRPQVKHLRSIFSDKPDPSCHADKKERDRMNGIVEDPIMKDLRKQAIAFEYKDMQDAARGYAAEMLQVLVDIAKDENTPAGARATAANSVLDRAHGKAAATNFNINQSAEADPEVLNGDELQKQAAALIKRSQDTDRVSGEEVGTDRPKDIRKYN